MNTQKTEKPSSASAVMAGYEHDGFNLSHPNTMIVAVNQAEVAYLEKYCEALDFLPPWIGQRDAYPVALSPNGNGWTDRMDRALYYVRFKDFINLVS